MKTLKELRQQQLKAEQKYQFEGTLYEQLAQAKEQASMLAHRGAVDQDLIEHINLLEQKLSKVREVLKIEEGGLWDNIHAKRKRIAAGSGEKMRKPGSKGAPTAQDFKDAAESIEETKAAPKGYHFTRDGKLKRGDADVDGPGGAKLRADPLDKQRSKVPPVTENFMDGKGPGKPGDAARHGLKGKSKAELQKIRSSDSASPRKKQLAHWMLNMHHKEGYTEEKQATLNNIMPAFKRAVPGDIYAGTDKLAKRYKQETPGQ